MIQNQIRTRLVLQTLTVTPVLTTKTLPLVLKTAATTALPGSVLQQRPPTVTMVTTAITKPDSQNTPINLQVASKLTNQSPEPVRLVSKNAMVVSSSGSGPLRVSVFLWFISVCSGLGWADVGASSVDLCCGAERFLLENPDEPGTVVSLPLIKEGKRTLTPPPSPSVEPVHAC